MRYLFFCAILFISITCKAQKNFAYHSLEASYIGLNALDLVTTYKVINSGGSELNPVMKLFIGNKFQAIAFKSFTTLGVLALNRMIAKDHPKTAIVSLMVLNVGMGYVVNRNYQIYLRIRL